MYLTIRRSRCRRMAAVLGTLAILVAAVVPHALADAEFDVSAPADPLPAPDEQVAPTDAQSAFTGTPSFTPQTIRPANGATVGVAMPIIINFDSPVADQAAAEQAIQISSDPPVPGKFYWVNASQVRWRPYDFWPAHTVVNIDAAGTESTFSTGDALVAIADDATHMMTVTRNGDVEQTFPISMGKPGHDTPNGTHYVEDKSLDVVMDSATYGVPNTSPDGYRVHVQLAVRFDNSGNYVHSAPWSVADQGERDVSHGCINVSPAAAKWFYDNFGAGDPIVVANSAGAYSHDDGAQDWQL